MLLGAFSGPLFFTRGLAPLSETEKLGEKGDEEEEEEEEGGGGARFPHLALRAGQISRFTLLDWAERPDPRLLDQTAGEKEK